MPSATNSRNSRAVMLASTSVLAFFGFQRGLQLGTAVAVIASMTAGTNVVAVLGGVIAFGRSDASCGEQSRCTNETPGGTGWYRGRPL